MFLFVRQTQDMVQTRTFIRAGHWYYCNVLCDLW